MLTFADIVKALPDSESKSSHGTYKSYLNKMGCIGYGVADDLIPYLSEPRKTCQDLKTEGIDSKDALNVFKVLKYCAIKASRYIRKQIVDDDAMNALNNYKTAVVDMVYGGEKIKVIKVNNKMVSTAGEADVTDIEDEDHEAAYYNEEEYDGDKEIRQEFVDMPALKRLQKQYGDLERKYCALRERMNMMDLLMLEVLKVTPSEGIIRLLYNTAMQSFAK